MQRIERWVKVQWRVRERKEISDTLGNILALLDCIVLAIVLALA